MVVKISENLEMKSQLPAPRSPLPAHVLAFPAMSKEMYQVWKEDNVIYWAIFFYLPLSKMVKAVAIYFNPNVVRMLGFL
jgi:hypothetical protein